MDLFPAFIKLAGRRVVIIGGGPVAASKLEALLNAGADITVVAPEIVPEIKRTSVTILERDFQLSLCFLMVWSSVLLFVVLGLPNLLGVQ